VRDYDTPESEYDVNAMIAEISRLRDENRVLWGELRAIGRLARAIEGWHRDAPRGTTYKQMVRKMGLAVQVAEGKLRRGWGLEP
jgi:hypothetical protein